MDNAIRKRQTISKTLQVAIFRRDGWLCRWCRKPVIFAPAMNLINRELIKSGYTGDLAYYHSNWSRRGAPLLDELGAVIDHAEAFSAGGLDNIENLVTACNKCNSQKSSATSGKWDEKRPRKFVKGKYGEPVHWDGFTNLFVLLARQDSTGLSMSEQQWLAAITEASLLVLAKD
jgi:5-methylcytosine-specific restriction endonuclease McrA